jgi:hypothetical protein
MFQRIESALRCAGRPMTRTELRAALGLSPLDSAVFYALQGRLPFVEVDGRRWGLAERDVPGGLGAFHRAVCALQLAACRSPAVATGVVLALGGDLGAWTPEMAASAYRVVKAGGAAVYACERLQGPISAVASAG